MSPNYEPPFVLFNPHVETIYPSLLRRVQLPPYQRERIVTPDEDFLDLDWQRQGSDKLIVISHGLEGNSTRAYVKGMARAGVARGFDILAWNYRGCSGETNRQLRFYHSGATDDLDCVIRHAAQNGYTQINLIGFSLGGNLTLKYIGERTPSDKINKVVTFSVPLDLHASCKKISQPSNWVYARRFLKSLKEKVTLKSRIMKELDIRALKDIATLIDFDDQYTAPLHGFRNAVDYYHQCSAVNFLNSIHVKTLIVNAQNDPFLSKECFPLEQLKHHSFVTLETPRHGGHVGFAQFHKNGLYWSEERAMNFISEV